MIILYAMAKQDARDKRRVKKAGWVPKLMLATAVFLTFVFIFITAIKVHASWMLAQAPGNWNVTQLARFDHSTTKFEFAVFGDTHNSTQAFGRIARDVENGKFLFAVDVGDQSIDAGNVKARMFINQVSHMKTPILTVVGNHDIAVGGKATEISHSNYEKVYGPRYYSFKVGKCKFIILDDAAGQNIDPEQMKWLRQELAGSNDYPTFLFMHVPTFRGRRDLSLPMEKFLQDRKNAEEFRQLCIASNVNLVFSGHCHTFDYDIWPGNVHYVVTGGGGGRLWDVEKYRGMYHWIKVTVDNKEGTFELEPIDPSHLHFIYQYIEEPWVYTYAFCTVRYFRLAVPIGLAIVLLTLGAWRGFYRKPE
jgi:UDP-2,3-diacylglucosamine pyrophosphatase LpxH